MSGQGRAIHTFFDTTGSVARVGGMTQPRPPADAATKALLAEIEATGFVVLRGLLSSAEVAEMRRETHRVMDAEEKNTGRNRFEGRATRRPYGLLGKSRGYDKLVAHERVTKLLDQLLLPNYLLTASQAIEILPVSPLVVCQCYSKSLSSKGELPQPLHFDDSFCAIPRPRAPLSMAIIVAIDPFTATNGATVVFPGSHKWDDLRQPRPEEGVPCIMDPGDAVFFVSTLWHGGGPNTSSDNSRMAVTFQYCEPFIRPQENQFLSVPFAVAKSLSPQIQSLLGYSVHPPFIGHSNGLHPLKALAKL